MREYKTAHQGKNKRIHYPSVDKILDKGLNTTSWRENKNWETLTLEKANAYVKWYKNNGNQLPHFINKKNRKTKKDKEEHTLATWISRYKHQTKTFPSVDTLLDEGK